MAGVPINPRAVAEALAKRRTPEWERGNILPIETNRGSGEIRPAVPTALQSIIEALSAPGNALQGQYQSQIMPDGRVDPYSSLIPQALNMASTLTLGSGAAPAPAGALRMGLGNMAKIASDVPPEGFPIRPGEPFPFMHNTEGAFNYVPKGSDVTALDPKGRFMIHDAGGLGRAPDGRWVKGEAKFDNPLMISEAGWKEKVSKAYGGATGKKLTELLRKDGYDGIVTFDKYGPSELVDLK